MAVLGTETDVDRVIDGLERLVVDLAAALVRRDPGAGVLVRHCLAAALDGEPGHPGPWFALRSPALMARMLVFAERLTKVAGSFDREGGPEPAAVL